jgi:4-diphosphocytidyl-2-C-methyl-D-erythritol kinase
MQRAFTLPSFAKINWMLRIIGKRPDGFHELFTIFQTVSLHDTISFGISDEITLTCDNGSVPIGEGNLILKAAKALKLRSKVQKGAAIHLEKRIPSPGGLGGGSSNAAVSLIGLNQLWRLGSSEKELLEIAAELGSDVPFFLTGGTAIGTARGEIIEPAAEIAMSNLLIVTPEISVSTFAAFAGLGAPTLTIEGRDHILSVCRNEAGFLDPQHSALINDFEASVFDAYPEIRRVKQTLLELGAVNAAMSGSGASVFAIFDKIETRQTAQKALDGESTWRKFAVATVSRRECRDLLHL